MAFTGLHEYGLGKTRRLRVLHDGGLHGPADDHGDIGSTEVEALNELIDTDLVSPRDGWHAQFPDGALGLDAIAGEMELEVEATAERLIKHVGCVGCEDQYALEALHFLQEHVDDAVESPVARLMRLCALAKEGFAFINEEDRSCIACDTQFAEFAHDAAGIAFKDAVIG